MVRVAIHDPKDYFFGPLVVIFVLMCVAGLAALSDAIFGNFMIGVACAIPLPIVFLFLYWKFEDKKEQAEKKQKKTATNEQRQDSHNRINLLDNEDFYRNVCNTALQKSNIKARIGSAAMIDIPISDDPEYILTHLETISMSGYFGNLDNIEELHKNQNLFSSIKMTAFQWFELYLRSGLNANDSAKFLLVWNHRGDIIGIVAYWTTEQGQFNAEFLPRGINRDVVATVPSNPNRSNYSFGIIPNSGIKWHPYRYKENGYGAIEIEEYVKDEWVVTGTFDMEQAAATPIKGKATLMTIPLLLELERIKSGCDWINKMDKQ